MKSRKPVHHRAIFPVRRGGLGTTLRKQQGGADKENLTSDLKLFLQKAVDTAAFFLIY